MHLRKLLLGVIVVAVVTFSSGLRAQGLIDGIKVTLPEAVTVGEKVLQPGEYEIRRPSSVDRQILRIFNKDQMVYETVVQTVATGPDEQNPRETKVVLHHIGDAYYFDKIWMEDKNYGWEFPLPERVRARQRESALSVPARYESVPSNSDQVSQQSSTDGPGLAAQLDALAAQQDREQAALAAQDSQKKAEHERQEQLDRDRQTELDRQRQERDRVAALQPERAPITPTQSDARATEPQSSIQPNAQANSQIPEQLPETATNWLALVFGGVLLVSLSFFVRPAREQG